MKKNTSKQRILITAYDFPPQTGGVSTYSLELAQSFSQQGHEVLVLTKESQLKHNYSFKVIQCKLPSSGVLSIPYFYSALKTHISSFNPDFIINTLWMPGATATYLALKKLKIQTPYLIVVHGMEIVESSRTFKKLLRSSLFFLKKKVFSHAHRCICISQFTKNLLLKQNICSENQIQVINNGVNIEKFSLNSSSSRQEKTYPQLLTVARLSPHKGIDQILYALPTLSESFPDIHYSIAGTGPDRTRLEKIVSDLSLHDSVSFLGKVDSIDLPNLYASSDLFVLLSRQEDLHVEGFGLVFLEAAITKTPSLGGNSGGIPDAIIEGKTGWLVDPTDQVKIVSLLTQLLHKPEELKEMGDQAYTHTIKYRSWTNVTQSFLKEMDPNHG